MFIYLHIGFWRRFEIYNGNKSQKDCFVTGFPLSKLPHQTQLSLQIEYLADDEVRTSDPLITRMAPGCHGLM